MRLEKTCKKHGELDEKDIRKEKSSQYKEGFYLRCNKCRLESSIKKAGQCTKHGALKPEDIKNDGRCSICHRESANRKRNLNREWFNAKMAKDKEENPEKWREIYKRQYKNSIENHGNTERTTKEIIRLRGIRVEQYEKMFQDQNNRCAICYCEETRKNSKSDKPMRLCVDHDHEAGIVRGLLCHTCNTALGKFRDNIDILH